MDERPVTDPQEPGSLPRVDGASEGMTVPGSRPLPPSRVGVYAGAAGLFTALPIPLLDRLLAGVARGAALRRVASRHGVRLSREGRRALASGGAKRARASSGGRLVRALAQRAVRPLRVASRLEDTFSVLTAAHLFDHYLSTAARPPGPIGREEAERLRRAMDRAAGVAVMDTARGVPRALFEAMRDAARAAVAVDDEDRSPVERTVDAFLDRLSEAQADSLVTLRARFDREMDGARGGSVP